MEFPGTFSVDEPPRAQLRAFPSTAESQNSIPFFPAPKAIPRPHGRGQLHRHLPRWYKAVDGGPGQHCALLGPAGRAAAAAARLHLPGTALGWDPCPGGLALCSATGALPAGPLSSHRGCSCWIWGGPGALELSGSCASSSLASLKELGKLLSWGGRVLWVGWDQGSGSCLLQQSPAQRGRAGALCPAGKGSNVQGDGAAQIRRSASPNLPHPSGADQQLQQGHKSQHSWIRRASSLGWVGL